MFIDSEIICRLGSYLVPRLGNYLCRDLELIFLDLEINSCEMVPICYQIVTKTIPKVSPKWWSSDTKIVPKGYRTYTSKGVLKWYHIVTLYQCATKVVPTHYQSGNKLYQSGTTGYQSGAKGSKTCQGGTKVVPKWYSSGTKAVPKWHQSGINVVPECN